MSRSATKKSGSKRSASSRTDAASDRRIAREIHTLALRIHSELAAREQRSAFPVPLPDGSWAFAAWGAPPHAPAIWSAPPVDPNGRR